MITEHTYVPMLCVYVSVEVMVRVRVTDHDTFPGNAGLCVVVVVTDVKRVRRGLLHDIRTKKVAAILIIDPNLVCLLQNLAFVEES